MQGDGEGGRKRSQNQQQAQPKRQRSPPQQQQCRSQGAKQKRGHDLDQAQDDGSLDNIFQGAARLVSALDDLRRFGLLSEEDSREILLPAQPSERTTQQDIVASLFRRLRAFSTNRLTTAEQRRLVGAAAGVVTYYRGPQPGPHGPRQEGNSQRQKQDASEQHDAIARWRHTLEVSLPAYRAARDKGQHPQSRSTQATQEHTDPFLAMLPYIR